uniref:Putative ovule protein n=1 Tax=Solanum chacoense TaxID=4108 RepID=A0A0V0GT51_SOLCH
MENFGSNYQIRVRRETCCWRDRNTVREETRNLFSFFDCIHFSFHRIFANFTCCRVQDISFENIFLMKTKNLKIYYITSSVSICLSLV